MIFCAVNFIDHRKYNSNKRSYYGIRNISDRLCRENGLSVVVPGRGSKGKSYAEYQAEKTGTSWKGKLKIAVDALIPQASDFADFLRLLQAAGYEIKPGKYISCRAPGQERFTRLKTLGADYTEEAITERIKGRRTRAAKAPKQERGGISLVIDIQNSIKAQESRGYEHWAKIHNLKQAARTLNFLTENRIDSYAELSAKIAEVNAASEQAAGALKGVERRLADMAVLIKHITTYQKTKPVYDAYRRAKDKAAYRAAHESSIILFEAAAKAVKPALIGGKLPNVAALQAEYAALGEQKEKLWKLTTIPVSRSRMSASIRSFSSGARISRKLTAPILRPIRKYLPSPKRKEDGATKSFVVSPGGVSQSQEKRNGSPSGWNTLCRASSRS